jgi:hypothetical protein
MLQCELDESLAIRDEHSVAATHSQELRWDVHSGVSSVDGGGHRKANKKSYLLLLASRVQKQRRTTPERSDRNRLRCVDAVTPKPHLADDRHLRTSAVWA